MSIQRPGASIPIHTTNFGRIIGQVLFINLFGQVVTPCYELKLIGVMLIVEGMGKHVEKGYIYFAMAFSLSVELINMRLRSREPIRLKQTYVDRVIRDDQGQ